MPTRRTLIATAAGGVAIAGAGGWWWATRPPELGSEAEPWSIPGRGPADIRLDALRHAVLAPSPHNLQPWRLRLAEGNAADLYCDLDRRLPETDPFDRQTVIGLGAFTEAFRLGVSLRGARLEVEPFPDGEPQPRLDGRRVARLTVDCESTEPDTLAAMLPLRRTVRRPYEAGLSPASIAAIRSAGGGRALARVLTEEPLLAPLRTLLPEAWRAEQLAPAPWAESVRVTRIGPQEIAANPDGIALRGQVLELLGRTGVLTRETLADPESFAFKAGLDDTMAAYASLPAALVILTPGNSRADQFDAGRAWMRATLEATRRGLDTHPASQALQEYPEQAPFFRRVHALLAPQGGRVQMLARLGRGPSAVPAPRWPAARALLSGPAGVPVTCA
jgi:nitroreductase